MKSMKHNGFVIDTNSHLVSDIRIEAPLKKHRYE